MEKLKKYSRFFKPLISAFFLAMIIFSSENATLPSTEFAGKTASNSPIDVAEPNKDKIGWLIKEEDGKYYKRLYNYSTGDWIGDWIYIGDVP